MGDGNESRFFQCKGKFYVSRCADRLTARRPVEFDPRRAGSILAVCVMLSLFLGGLTSTAKCATARLYNGSWFAGGNGRANQDKTYYPTAWWTSNSTKAIIYYTCTLDAGGFAGTPVPLSLPKFTGPPLAGWTWTPNFSNSFASGANSVTCNGFGSSTSPVAPATAPYTASWQVGVNGSGSFDGQSNGTDPWELGPSDLTGFSTYYNFYYPVSILAGSSSNPVTGNNVSSYSASVTYQTAAGNTTLLSITVNYQTATVTSNAPNSATVTFYQLPSTGALPVGSQLPGTPITLSQIQSFLQSNTSNGTLGANLDLGISATNVPIPTTAFSDGALAAIGATTSALEDTEGASPPTSEPLFPIWAVALFIGLIAFAGAALFSRLRFTERA